MLTSTPRAGTIHVYLAGSLTGGHSQPIVITGSFADAGRFIEAAPDSNVKLSKGSFKVDDSQGAAKESQLFARLPSLIDPKSCGVAFSYTAPAALKDGTGAYRGIRGTVRVTTTDAGVFPKLPDGKCNISNNARPIGFMSIAHGAGSVSLS